MANDKWFYPANKKISAFLNEHYGDNYRCEFQDVCEEVVYDTYLCWTPPEQGKQQEQQRITFIIHKPMDETTRHPALIEVMYAKYEHTMQYFNPEK